MTILTYEVFEAVVTERSFQRAAESLNMTPSAVSHAISAMEKKWGLRCLFVESRRLF